MLTGSQTATVKESTIVPRYMRNVLELNECKSQAVKHRGRQGVPEIAVLV